MTSHRDILAGLADDRIRAYIEAGADCHLTEATALRAAANALDKVRAAVERINRLGNEAWDEWKRTDDMYRQGQVDAYGDAHTLLIDALGDTK